MSLRERAESRRWDLQRFGLRPGDIRHRLKPRGPKIHLVSVPKAGTHLLERLFCLYPGIFRRLIPGLNPWNVRHYGGAQRVFRTTKPGRVLVTHLHHNPAVAGAASRYGMVNVFAIRDPRAVAISKAHYLVDTARHPYNSAVRELSFEEVLIRVLDGDDEDPERRLLPAAEEFSRLSGWLEGDAITVRYEDLMRFEPGGARLDETVVARVLEACGLAGSDSIVGAIARAAVSPVSRTFRQPRLRPWEALPAEKQTYLEEALAGPIAQYGYSEYWDR